MFSKKKKKLHHSFNTLCRFIKLKSTVDVCMHIMDKKVQYTLRGLGTFGTSERVANATTCNVRTYMSQEI